MDKFDSQDEESTAKHTRQHRSGPYRLTDRERLYVKEYLLDLNASAATRRAGLAEPPSGPAVTGAIQWEMDRRARRANVRIDEVVTELKRIAFSDPAHVFDSENRLCPVRAMPQPTRRAVSSIKVKRVGGDDPCEVIEIKFWDKTAALTLLGKHLGMLTEKVEISGSVSLRELLTPVGAARDLPAESAPITAPGLAPDDELLK